MKNLLKKWARDIDKAKIFDNPNIEKVEFIFSSVNELGNKNKYEIDLRITSKLEEIYDLRGKKV